MFLQAGNERSVGIKTETSDGPIATQRQKHIVGFIYLYVVSLTGAVSNNRMTGEWWTHKDVVESDGVLMWGPMLLFARKD